MANPPVNAGLSNADAAQWECPLCPQERFGFDHDAVDGKAYLHEIVTAFNNPPNGSAEIHTCAKEVLSMILEMIEKLIQYDFGTVFAQPGKSTFIQTEEFSCAIHNRGLLALSQSTASIPFARASSHPK
jgi:hypothetical protein